MRIVAGTARGRLLQTPDGDDVRPTSGRVRESVFNSLFSHNLVQGRTMLDLFAGTGALGLEAISRGAEHVTFVDADRRSVDVVRANVAALGFTDRATVRLADGVVFAGRGGAFDVALLDPPYVFDGWSELLSCLDAGAIAIESDRAIDVGSRWRILKDKRYAGTFVTIASRVDAGDNPTTASSDPDPQEGSSA